MMPAGRLFADTIAASMRNASAMRKNRALPRSLALLVVGFCIWLLWPAEALAQALVRFIHAVPGAGAATVEVEGASGTTKLGTVAFAQSTPWHSIRSGSFHWLLVGGGKTLAQGTSTVGNGAYDIVALAQGPGVSLGIYKARGGEPGTSLVRVIHAAPELGSPELELDSRIVAAHVNFTQATPYLTVSPGLHSLSAMRPGDTAPLVSLKGVRFVPGVAYSAIVVGSRGQMVRVVTVTDRGAPLTRPAPKPPAPPKHGHPAGASPAQPAARPGWITVKPGDSLWLIARHHLGEAASNVMVANEVIVIWNANALRIGTGDPNLIFPGQRLHIPG
jgi:LysM repeat protein